MLNFSDLLDRASELLNTGNLQDALGTNLTERLGELGIDSSLLDGVQLDDLQSLLDNSGVDMTALSETQLGELVTSVKENGGIEGLDIKSLLDQASN